MATLLLLLLVVGCCVAVVAAARQDLLGLENSPVSEVSSVSGSRAVLPCPLPPRGGDDKTIMVLFYQGASGTPIYSVDGRSSPLSMADHWQDPTTLGVRAKFSLDLNPPGLIINPVHLSDQGLYRCRVDFRSSRSWNKIIRLSIVEPPRSVRLYETGAPVTEGREGLAPHQEGDLVSLTCEVHGGIPYPTVSWWYRGVRITPAPTTREGDVTRSSIDLPRLSRNDLKAEVTCQASNTNSTAPLVVTELVNLTLPPLAVTLHGISTPLSEGVSTSVVCESVGSRPPATLTWWWNDAPLHRTSNLAPEVKTQNFDDGNVTRSTLVIAPQLSDEGASVTCGARNSHLNHSLMQDTGTITVHYIPRLQLKPGQSIDLEDIKEGADAYFECDIVANPRAFKVVWLHNGMELEHNVSAGVIQSNQSLVLQRLRRASSGEYICTATNARGTGLSEPVTLVVKYAPVCKTRDPDVRGAGKHERLNVTCEVDAHPPATAFRWAFNTSAEVVSIDPGRIEAVSGDLRDVVYTPRSQLDYGSLLCWATNSVGEQRVPCVFHIIHTAVPEPVHNCSVSEVSRTSAAVRCQGGWDGGLPQTFTLSVSQDAPAESSSSSNSSSSAPRVLANTSSSPKAEFSVTGLDAGKEYVLTVSAVNARGQSSPVRISLLTLEDKAQKRTSPGVTPKPKGELPLGPIIAGLVGAMASLLLSCIVIVLVVRARRSPHRGQCSRGGSQTEKSDSQSTANLTEPSVTTYIDTGESSPDVIPYTNVPTPPRSATVPMSLTFNNLSLMDVEHHHHHHHTLHQPPARLLQGQDVLYVAADLAAMQRTGSLPRPGLGKKPRDMSQLNRLDNSQLHNTLASPHSHASLRSLDQLGGGPPFVAPVGIMSEAVGQRPNSPPTASSQSKRHLSALVRGESVSLRGESDPVSDGLDKALVPSNQHQGTLCLKSQLKSRQQADPELCTSRQDRFSPTLRGSPLAVPYSPSSTSTTSSAQSGQLERTSGSENTTAYPPPAFSGVIRKTNNLVDAESNILNSPISAKVLPNTPSRSEFSDAIDVSSVCQLPPLDENVRYDGKVYSKNETFFSPPPMFSNSMPPFVVPKAAQEYLPTGKVVFEDVLNKSRVKNQQITDMKLVRLAADGPGQQIKTSARPAQPSALDKDPAQRSHSGRSASPLNKKESSV